MKRFIKIALLIIMCAALCVAVLKVFKTDTKTASASGDDRCRTTYEIFVSSFCDSDGDGIGDINGIRSKLNYISDLGFSAIWLTPVHPSSTYHKYDVDDYYAIDPAFGTMEDYEALINECHERGIRVYLDLVLNHSSEDHEWFRAASDYLHELPSDWEPDPSYCKYFDYYNFTREPMEGYAPLEGTNWYYESRFWSGMPDLNLRSEFVKDEIRGIMEFWLGKGVDGFRLDAVTSYFTNDTDANSDFLRFLNETAKSIDPDCYLVGEAWTDMDTIASLYSSGIDSLFDFPFATDGGCIAGVINGSRSAYDYVNDMIWSEGLYGSANPGYVDAPFYTNHDMARNADYYPGDDGSQAKMAYALSLFMTGNAFVYYGEELGMSGSGKDENYRAPMYWSDEPGAAGRCAGPPGMDLVGMKYPSLEDQEKDKHSMYNWFADVIRVRNDYPAIAGGRTELAESLCDDNVAAFYRRSESDGDLLILMNLRGQAVEKDLSGAGKCKLAESLTTNKERITLNGDSLSLPAYSIAVLAAD